MYLQAVPPLLLSPWSFKGPRIEATAQWLVDAGSMDMVGLQTCLRAWDALNARHHRVRTGLSASASRVGLFWVITISSNRDSMYTSTFTTVEQQRQQQQRQQQQRQTFVTGVTCWCPDGCPSTVAGF